MVIVVLLAIFCVQVAVCDLLWVTGGFTGAGSLSNTAVVRNNGFYFDDHFHIQAQGNIYAMCRSRAHVYLGGDFNTSTENGPASNFVKTNTRYTSKAQKSSPVISPQIYGYSNSYFESFSYPWSAGGNDESGTNPKYSGGGGGGYDDDDGYSDSGYSGYNSGGSYSGGGSDSGGSYSGGGSSSGGGDDDDDDDDDGFVNYSFIPDGYMKDGVYHDTMPSEQSMNVNGPVYDLFCGSYFVFLVGEFDAIGNTSASNFAKYDTDYKSFTAVDGPDGRIYAIAGHVDDIYIGGDFTIDSTLSGENYSITSVAYYYLDGWWGVGHNLIGVVYDLAMTPDGYYLIIGGQFTVENNTNIENFLVLDIAHDIQNTKGAGGTIRKLFYDRNTDTLYVGGNFGVPGLDEVRFFDFSTSEFISIGNLYFVGEVLSIASISSGTELAVGGNFTSVIYNNQTLNYSNLIIFKNKEVTGTDVNGPVYTMLSQHTHFNLMFWWTIAALGLVVLCGFGIICIKRPERRSERLRHTRDEGEIEKMIQATDKKEPNPRMRGHPVYIFAAFLAFVFISCLLQLDVFNKDGFKSIKNFDEMTLMRAWHPSADKRYGFALAIPFLAVPVVALFGLFVQGRKKSDPAQKYHYSYQFKTKAIATVFLSYLIWLLFQLGFYSIPSISQTLLGNSFCLALVFFAVQEFVSSVLLAQYHSFRKNGDTTFYLINNTSFYIVSRILLVSLHPRSESAPVAVAVFVPLLSYFVHFVRVMMNLVLSKKQTYTNIPSEDGDAREPWSISLLLFSLRCNKRWNKKFRLVEINKQLFMRIADYVLLTGAHPLSSFVTLTLTVADLILLLSHKRHHVQEILGGYFYLSFFTSAALSFLAAPLSPATFVSLRVFVMQQSVFVAALCAGLCFAYLIMPRKASTISFFFGIIYFIPSILSYAMTWQYAANWTVYIPIFAYLCCDVVTCAAFVVILLRTC